LLSYERLSRKPRLFKSFTGLSVKQFDDIYKEIESKYEKYEIKRLSSRRNRERDIGGGRRFKLVIKDRIVMVLVYYRLYITYTLMEFLFDLNQSNVCRDIQKIEGLIRSCLPLPIPQKIYNITKRLNTKEEVEKYFPDLMAFIDCTEQPIPRPKNRLRRRLYYSGKKKKHTVKNLYAVNQKGLIIYKSKHKQIGRKHDYKIYKENHPDIPKDIVNMFDLGFLGVEKEYPEQKSELPIKKKRNQVLMKEEKEYNRNHSRRRIVVEHAFCRIKKYRIMNDVFRNRLEKYNKASDIVTGLINYRISNIC
jgi:DDE superfamily endonuclease/Helix-turn-helix of DDE superfamily endonuclease